MGSERLDDGRLGNNFFIRARNAARDEWYDVIGVSSSNILQIGGSATANANVASTNLHGTTITANGSMLVNSGVVNGNVDTLTVTAALHANSVIRFGKTSGTTATLPAATGTGNIYRFVISVAATSNANIIQVANATDVMAGSVAYQQDTDSAGSMRMWLAGATDDTITLAGVATTGGIAGAYIECIDYISGGWSCRVHSSSGGGSEATPFSATVS